jgi:hypothetical protein
MQSGKGAEEHKGFVVARKAAKEQSSIRVVVAPKATREHKKHKNCCCTQKQSYKA